MKSGNRIDVDAHDEYNWEGRGSNISHLTWSTSDDLLNEWGVSPDDELPTGITQLRFINPTEIECITAVSVDYK